MVELTLLRRASPLAQSSEQRRILSDGEQRFGFEQVLADHGRLPLRATGIEVLQINVGKLCNQTCRHCHVDAGPDRREVMSRETAEACLDVLRRSDIPTLDITGGAPEMNPHFRWLVTEARGLGRRVIDRCNLTILVAPGFDDLPEFLGRTTGRDRGLAAVLSGRERGPAAGRPRLSAVIGSAATGSTHSGMDSPILRFP